MNIKKLMVESPLLPESIRQLKPPVKQLYYRGDLPTLLQRPRLAVVGTRSITPYGQQITYSLAGPVAEQGVVIVSGLAYGVDSAAHQAALEAGGLTMAVLPGPLDNIAPAGNQWLADQILAHGGALISEYPVGEQAFRHNFVLRNRVVAALANAILITEAGLQSGTTHTAGYAEDQGTTVLAVPGDVTRPQSAGTNQLLKTNRAAAVTSYEDVLLHMGLALPQKGQQQIRGKTTQQQIIIDLLLEGINEGNELFTRSQLDISHFNQALTLLEIDGKVRPLGANRWALK